MNALDVRELTKVYPAFTLDHISFSVPEKHVVGLIGRNGTGKSTAIKSILRFVSSQGAVRVFGKDMEENEREIKQEIGYVGGGFRHYPLKTLAAVRRAYSAFYPLWDAKKYGEKDDAADGGDGLRADVGPLLRHVLRRASPPEALRQYAGVGGPAQRAAFGRASEGTEYVGQHLTAVPTDAQLRI